MSRSTQTVSTLVRSAFEVYDDNADPVTGLVNGSFTKFLSRNGVDDATAVTVVEIGNGRYEASFTPGSVGHWHLLTRHATFNKRGWSEDFDVIAQGP